MAFERRKFRSLGPDSHLLGTVIEYNPDRGADPSTGWRWTVCAVLAVAMAISFVSTRGCFSRAQEDKKTPVPPEIASVAARRTSVPAVGNIAGQSAGKREPENAGSPAAKELPKQKKHVAISADSWTSRMESRPQHERTLLMRLADAERLGELEIAVDTIEKLRKRPAMADLDDRLARRLGVLNMQRIFSGNPVPWIAETTVRRGQTVHRIAREHGSTVAAVRRLNNIPAGTEPEPGQKLRVLAFPKAAFVVHKKTRYADLTLGGKLFKRYYVSVKDSCPAGIFPITSRSSEGPRSRFAELGIQAVPVDMQELDMFLAPGSTLTVSEL